MQSEIEQEEDVKCLRIHIGKLWLHEATIGFGWHLHLQYSAYDVKIREEAEV